MEEKDTQELDFTPVEGEKPVPVGWRMLFWGLVAFGAWYLWAYSPALSGWTQTRDLEAAGTGSGVNVFATVLFTALAVLAALSIVLAMSRRKHPAGSGPSTGSGQSGRGA